MEIDKRKRKPLNRAHVPRFILRCGIEVVRVAWWIGKNLDAIKEYLAALFD